MHTAAAARYLAALGLVDFGDNSATCFLEQAPAEPVDCVTIVSQPGVESDAGSTYDAPEMQILVRSSGSGGEARDGYEWAAEIRDALHGLSHVTFGAGTPDELRVISCHAKTSAPLSLGKDSAGHHRWSVAYRLDVRHETPLRV